MLDGIQDPRENNIQRKEIFIIEKWQSIENKDGLYNYEDRLYYVDTINRNGKLIRLFTKNRDNALEFDTYEQAYNMHRALNGGLIGTISVVSYTKAIRKEEE